MISLKKWKIFKWMDDELNIKKWKWDVKLFKPIELTSIFLVNLGLQTVGKLFNFLFSRCCFSLFIFYFNICILPILETDFFYIFYILLLFLLQCWKLESNCLHGIILSFFMLEGFIFIQKIYTGIEWRCWLKNCTISKHDKAHFKFVFNNKNFTYIYKGWM